MEVVDGTGETGTQNDPALETIESAGAATGTGEEGEQARETSFFDPSQLSEELKPQWKSMHRAYTKKMEEFKSLRDKAAMVDRFNSDPEYAAATISQRAQQMGYRITRAEAERIAENQAQNGSGAPDHLVRTIASSLAPELQWMARSLADASWAAQQETIGPMKQKAAQEETDRKNGEYDELSSMLGEKFPGWEEHETEMNELMDFLESDKLSHRRWGSKLEILHNIVTSNASAISTVTDRMSHAARNRIVTGQTNRTSVPNVSERVQKARTTQEAWDIAKKAALEASQRGQL